MSGGWRRSEQRFEGMGTLTRSEVKQIYGQRPMGRGCPWQHGRTRSRDDILHQRQTWHGGHKQKKRVLKTKSHSRPRHAHTC